MTDFIHQITFLGLLTFQLNAQTKIVDRVGITQGVFVGNLTFFKEIIPLPRLDIGF